MKIINFIKEWTLPISMITGVLIYLAFKEINLLEPLKPAVRQIDAFLAPSLIFIQLLLTFCKVNPREFRFRKWHFILITLQLLLSAIAYLALRPISPVLAQGALVCFICPTATAAAVITGKLGGSAETLITYTILINIIVAIVVPLTFPAIYPQPGMDFLTAFLKILSKVFPLLILPFIIAQILRYVFPRAHAWMHDHSGLAFYVWAIALALVMGKTAKAIVDDADQLPMVFALAIVALVACAIQFLAGKNIAGHYNDRISGGQAIGQKNTVFAIWMAYTYLDPLSSVAPGAYVLWQNIVNSYQLWKKQHHPKTT